MLAPVSLNHPLLPVTLRAVNSGRRPRFTTAEAVILNALVNQSPEWVSIADLQDWIKPFTVYPPTQQTIRQHIGSLRAKLGDRRNKPEIIVSIRKTDHLGFSRVIGYRFVEE